MTTFRLTPAALGLTEDAILRPPDSDHDNDFGGAVGVGPEQAGSGMHDQRFVTVSCAMKARIEIPKLKLSSSWEMAAAN